MQNEWVEKDLYTNNWEISKGEVASGKAAMYFLGNWVIPQVIGAGAASEDIGFFPLPYDNSGKYNAPLGSDYFIAVSKDSKNKELATAGRFLREGIRLCGRFRLHADHQVGRVFHIAACRIPIVQSDVDRVKQTDPKFNEIANKAQIGMGTGDYVQEYIVADDLQARSTS